MSGYSKTAQSVLAAFAALLMSSVAVGAAVGPAQAVASPAGAGSIASNLIGASLNA